MINLYVLTDALPSTLFGIFALWAAGSRRHWFVRLAVASAALLIILLIPAYEVLVEFALAMSFSVTGITVWR